MIVDLSRWVNLDVNLWKIYFNFYFLILIDINLLNDFEVRGERVVGLMILENL